MSSGIYIGMSAASARNRRLDAVADSLANVNTPGFKAARSTFEGLLAESNDNVQPGNDKVLVRTTKEGLDMSPGAVVQTHEPLDVLPENQAFLGVTLGNGELAYTRDGRLMVDGNGQLLAGGRPVVSAGGGPIFVPLHSQPTISKGGHVMVEGRAVDQLGFFRLEGDLERVGPRLVMPREGGQAESTIVDVQTGVIEQGNVSAIDATVELVNVQRSFDHAMQAIDTYKRLDETATNVGRIR